MDETMEVEELLVNSNSNSKEKNALNENINSSDSDDVNKLKIKQSDCNNTTDEDVGDLNNSTEVHKDEISSETNGNQNCTEVNNSHDVKDIEPNSPKNHENISECNKSDELTPKLNDSDHVEDSDDKLNDSDQSKIKSESLSTTAKPSLEPSLTDDSISAKKDEEKLKESDLDKECQDNVSSCVDATKEVKVKIEIKEEEEETEAKENHEVKKKEESGKKKKGKICVECGKKKKIEFRIHFQGKVHTLCSETCYKQFKTKQSAPKPQPVVQQPKVLECVKENPCSQCQKNIAANQGYYPVVGDIKPLCSEDCVRKYQDNNGPPRKCSQCDKKVEDKSCHLSWETMVFCSEDCLGKYQSFLGSHCTCCQAPVQQASLGKYCVCFGSDIRQFCSGSCLDDFKKGLKVCTFCQTDLSAGTEGFLAPVGDKGQFKDFCSQACMERYEVMNNLSKTAPEIQECAHCKKQGSFKIQVPYNDKKYFLCCDNCVAGLRCTLKKTDNVCASCHHFYTLENDVKNNNEQEFKFKMDGLYKFFCSKTCMTTYVLSHRRITQCQFCKVKKYNFDMIEKTDRNVGSQIFCSLNCLSLYRVNVNAASAKSIRCDNCSKNHPAQYHLTMSDGSIRNFCTYTCVLAFQNQFTSVPALTTTSMTRQMTTTVQTLKTTSAVSSPIIANVMSLAQPRPGAPSAPKPLVPQTLVSVRPPPRQPVAVFTTKPQNSTSTITSPSVSIGQSSVASSSVMREVIVQPPAPKSVKNKSVWCKPIMQTKGVNAKTPACHKAVQTDENPRPVILPVPIPVYVPTPLHMFSRPVPCPVPFPVPIPIPIIINSSKEPQNQVIKHLKKIKGSIPANSQDELSNATFKSTDDSNKSQSDAEKQSEDVSNDVQTVDSVDEEHENDAESDEPQYYIKQNKSNHKRVHSSHKHKKHKKIKLEQEDASEESGDTPATEDEEINPSFPSAGSSFSVNFNQPGTSFQQSSPRQNNVFETPDFNFEEEEQTMLKMKYGMNALKLWILKKNSAPLTDLPYTPGGLSVKRKFYKTDILLLSPPELESYLIQFIQEARNDANSEYSGGALYFLCLSIQLFLLENGKTDNIFTDIEYDNFAQVLHNILIDQETKAFLHGQPLVKNKEEILWDTDQLGVQSPLVLLNTLIFFYTKYFHLKTVEAHAQLRFSNVVLVTNNETQTLSLRYYPSGINHNDKVNEIMEIKERPDRLIRCPVKLYEFYLQRCPPQAMEKSYPLYLEPEKNCSPERDVWFSPFGMSQELINRQLQRLKFIEEANL